MKKPRSPIDQIEFMRNLLAFLLVGAFVSSIPVFVIWTVPEANEQLVTYMIGQLSGMATTALGFYFINKVGQDALDATRADNTNKMADAIKSALHTGNKGELVEEAAEDVAEAAVEKAGEFKGGRP